MKNIFSKIKNTSMRKRIILAMAIIVISLFSKTVFAVWNGTFYNPGDTLNPECLPTDVNCDVRSPLTSTSISDVAYGVSWNADTTHAPSKNAVYNQIETLVASNHNPVTLGTANGLSLATQVLSLALASTSTTGALSNTDWNTFNGKQDSSANLTSVSGLSYVSPSFVKMTAAGTFALDTTVLGTLATQSGTFSGTSSGTNTGDETQATIKTKLGAATTLVDGYLTTTDWNTFNNKQATLVSGTNIKTINGGSILGSGNLVLDLSGYIPYTGGTSNVDLGVHNFTVDTSSLFVDSLNHRVGIGTITPNNAIQVANLIDFNNTDFNTKLGYQAGKNIVANAQNNTFIGYQAGTSSATLSTSAADFNSAFGYQSFFSNTGGSYNTASGVQALYSNTNGNFNTASGTYALFSNTTGSYNTASGMQALYNNSTGTQNTASGMYALTSNTTGSYNTASGMQALNNNSTGNSNVALGLAAGYNETGSNTFYVNNIYQPSLANDRNYSLLYGKFSGVAGSLTGQQLTINGNLGIGTLVPAGILSVTPTQYSTGTASQSLTTITGVGTTFTSAMIGSQFVFANGTSAGTITAFGSTTSLTVSTSQTVASQAYNIGYTGLQVGSTGNVGIGTTTPNNLIQVANLIDFNNTDFDTKLGYQAGKNIVAGAINNTFIGYQTGLSSAVGSTSIAGYNTAIGFQSFFSNTTGYSNVAVGYQTLFLNTTGVQNVANGISALGNNTTGNNNTANGANSLLLNSTGSGNVALGYGAGKYETGSNAFYINNVQQSSLANDKAFSLLYGKFSGVAGSLTGQQLTVNGNLGIGTITPNNLLQVAGLIDFDNASFLTSLGYQAGTANYYNSYVGYQSGFSNVAGGNNTAIGYQALYSNGTSYNTAVGASALASASSGGNNSALGAESLAANSSGSSNNAMGYQSLRFNTTGINNNAIGTFALRANTTGSNNSAVGYNAGRFIADGFSSNSIGSSSLFLGNDSKANADGQTNQIVIGASAIGIGSNSVVLGNDSILTTALKGSVGIGTVIPSGILSVTPTQYSTGTASQSLTTVTGVGTVWTSAMVGSQFVFANGTSAGTITAFGSTTSLTVSTSQTVASQAYNIAYTGLQVGSTGNVGIGTTAPGALLSIGSNSGGSTTIPTNSKLWITGTTGTSPTVPQGRIDIGFNNNPDYSTYVGSINVDNGVTPTIGVIGTRGSAVDSPAIYLKSGNVGIGTTAPLTKLQVLGEIFSYSAAGSNSFYLGGNGVSSGSGLNAKIRKNIDSPYDLNIHSSNSATNAPLYFHIDDSEGAKMAIDTAGNVGIGTTSPGFKLDIVSDGSGNANNTTTGGSFASGRIASNQSLVIRHKSDAGISGLTFPVQIIQNSSQANDLEIYSTGATPLVFGTNATERLRINSSGDISVGSSTTYGNFSVNATRTTIDRHAFEDWSVLNTTDTNLGYADFDAHATLTNGLAENHFVAYQARNIFNGSANVTDRFVGFHSFPTITGAGTLTNVYGVKLDDITGTGAVTNDYGLYIGNVTKGSTSNYAIYSAGGTNYFAGNVGIGTTTPASKLDILDTTLAGSGSLAGSVLNLAQTWNTTGTPTAIKLNVTNTASNGASLFMDLQVGGVSKFSVRGSDGYTSIVGGANINNVLTNGDIRYVGGSGTNGTFPINLGRSTSTNTAGAGSAVSIIPTYNQVASTAANTDLLINRTETAVGSGAQLLIDAQVGSVSKFSVTNTGVVQQKGCTTAGTLSANASGDIICTISSQRFKNDITDLNNGLSSLMNLRPVSYTFKPEMNMGSAIHFGFISEEVAAISPEYASHDAEGKPYGLDTNAILSTTVKAIQEMNLNIEGVAGTVTPLPGSPSESFATAFFKNVFAKVTVWLADATNGIGDIFAGQVNTKSLCVTDDVGGKTCITKAQLDALISNAGASVTPTPTPTPDPSPAPAPVPDPVPAPTPDPVPVVPTCTAPQTLVNNVCTDPAPAPDPVPVPDPAPAPDPVPVPDPAPTPDPAPAPAPAPDPAPVAP
ncbi:MAG: tail fiber domain-containing protein [Candidatus Paceibacterota bacterium]|jgi:hypothetical protein